MDMQLGFNIAVALVGGLGGWILRSMQESIKANSEKIQAVEVLVAGKYAASTTTMEYLAKQMDALFALLRRIEDKLDGKADK